MIILYTRPDGGVSIITYASKENLEKVMTGEYSVINQSYSDPPVLITNSNKNIIDPLNINKGDNLYGN